MTTSARLIRRDELDRLRALYRELHPEDPEVAGSERLRQLWDEISEDRSLLYIVVDTDGDIVASCAMAVVKNLTRGMRPYAVIENVITRRDMRRRGYGTMALHKAIDLARERGCYKVMLLSGARDEATLRFYENAGFTRGVKTGFIVQLSFKGK
jgi:GNAT superfamily N-acetyltransferase